MNAIQTTDTIDLVKKKTDYDTKFSEIEKAITDHDHSNKYITTLEFNYLTAKNFTAILKQANLALKKDNKLEGKKKITDLSNKVTQISEKKYDLLLGGRYFTVNDGYQNFLVFAPIFNSIILDSNRKVTNWISTGISSEILHHLILILN